MTQDLHEPDYLKRLRVYPGVCYEHIDLTGLAAFVISQLQEQRLSTTIENITVALFRLFPTKFALSGFPAYPDSARVGRSLMQLGPKYRNWARGSVQKGFVLTESGARKVDDVKKILEGKKTPAPSKRSSATSRLRTMDMAKEISPLENSPLFALWKNGNLSKGRTLDFLIMLGAYSYTPSRAIKARLKVLDTTAEQLGRKDIMEFLRAIRKQFSEQLASRK
ncbi:MAG: hypothetical protein ACRES9_03485 [Gammaproteobacteria bacterium]